MKSKHIIILGILAFLSTIVFYSLTGGESPEDYTKAILKEREEKDIFMKSDSESPFRSVGTQTEEVGTQAKEVIIQTKEVRIQTKEVRIQTEEVGKQTEEVRTQTMEVTKQTTENVVAEDSTKKEIDFKGLNYFAPDLKFKVNANLAPIENKKVIVLPTSDGKEKKYLEYAFAEFSLEGKQNKLLILEIMDAGPYRGTLFLAFADATSANETYGAGRYIDLKKVPGASTMVLDFNKAYNPYCAYSDDFSCPFPPKENVLTIAVKAGEKKYHD